jgi:HK97 family phage prohead protease
VEHKTLTAATEPVADLGEFSAIAAAWSVDRERDVIHRGAFTQTIGRWRDSQKKMPLHWDHRGDPENIIGWIDPASMEETDDGLLVKGQLDLEGSELARQAWRLIKQGTVGLSFGYLATKKSDRPGGGRDLFEIDMFETSITPAPMHPDTRILEAKSQPSEDELRHQTAILERDQIEDGLRDVPEVREPDPEPEPEPEPTPEPVDPVELRRKMSAVDKITDNMIRDRIGRNLKDIPPLQPPPPPEPEPEPEPMPEPMDAAQLKRAIASVEDTIDRVVRDRITEHFKDLPAVRPDPEPEPEPEPEPVDPEDVLRRKTVDVEAITDQVVRDRITKQLEGIPPVRPPEPDPEPQPEPESVDSETELRRKHLLFEREQMAEQLRRLETKVSAEPFSTSQTSNWVARAGGLPHYIQHVAHDLMQERGMSESQAIQMAIGICKRWAAGGANVSADTRAKAAAAIAEWEKMKAKTGKAVNPNSPTPDDLQALVSSMSTDDLLALFEALYAALVPDVAPPTSGKSIAAEEAVNADIADRIATLEHQLHETTLPRQAATRPRSEDDDVRRQSEQAVLDLQLDGVSRRRKSPPPEHDAEAQAAMADRLRRETRDEWLNQYLRR